MKYKKSVFRNLAMVTQLGISVLAPIFLCIFIGYQVDSRYGMKTLVPLLILGVLAGAKSAWHLAMRTLMQECREDEAILQERESQKERTGSSRPKQPSRIRRNQP
ncbi:MAG: AtpZ/AtpI family protein [Lachnospiraceae bacterium]|nr:AtpZ/AtpI family protein [Lachnospiraceae bacterium]